MSALLRIEAEGGALLTTHVYKVQRVDRNGWAGFVSPFFSFWTNANSSFANSSFPQSGIATNATVQVLL
jgi:hypothetical protein